MKLKLDENLGSRGATVLRSAGHDVATVYEQRLTSADDGEPLRVCGSEDRSLVTLDLDFGNPLRYPPIASAGIAVLRPPSPIRQSDLLLCCQTLANHLEQADIHGKLWIVELSRIRC